jgi:sulfur-carrier protein adenylyltransferase/sulfurtransferase
MALSDAELERYSRHLLLAEVGPAGQEKLRAARVLVVGAGGLGSPAALYLAASGVGTVGIVDCDRIDLSNLQRQILYGTDDVGQSKAVVAGGRLRALNPAIAVVTHALELRSECVVSVIGQYDVVVDGTDRLATRYLVNDACVILGKPLVAAAIHRFEGQAMTYLPGRGPCYRCLFPEAVEAAGASCAEAGVLGVLPGVLGTIQATEAIKVILGIGEPLVGRLLTYDALEMRFREFPFERRRDCAVCGDAPRITVPTDVAAVCRDDPVTCRRLSPRELAALLRDVAHGGPPVRLIDVREPAEFSAGHLAGALSMPLAELEHADWTTANHGATVFVCRSGARSARACAIASRQGLSEPGHLEGGLIAWAAAIDPTLRVA